MFRCPTKLGSAVESMAQEPDYAGLDIALRIAKPTDVKQNNFKGAQAVSSHYKLAHYHVEQLIGNINTSRSTIQEARRPTPPAPVPAVLVQHHEPEPPA